MFLTPMLHNCVCTSVKFLDPRLQIWPTRRGLPNQAWQRWGCGCAVSCQWGRFAVRTLTCSAMGHLGVYIYWRMRFVTQNCIIMIYIYWLYWNLQTLFNLSFNWRTSLWGCLPYKRTNYDKLSSVLYEHHYLVHLYHVYGTIPQLRSWCRLQIYLIMP